MVVAELACGTPPAPHTQTLADIGLLEPARQALQAGYYFDKTSKWYYYA
jgi:hypothetical protein